MRMKCSLLLAMTTALIAQTRLDLRTQARSADFSQFPSTRPLQTGMVLPATCAIGDVFYKTDAAAGLNIYGCTATNVWTVQSSPALPSMSGRNGGLLTTNGVTASWSALGGDVTGAPFTVTVAGIQNRPISNAAPQHGSALVWNASDNQWQPQLPSAVTGAVAVQLEGVTTAARPTIDLHSASGTIAVQVTDDPVNNKALVDLSISPEVPDKAGIQANTLNYCASTGTNSSDYSCQNTSHAWNAYTDGMVVWWNRTQNCIDGPVTLHLSALDPKRIYKYDGVTNPGALNCPANVPVQLMYSAAIDAFRIVSTPVNEPLPPENQTWAYQLPLASCSADASVCSAHYAAGADEAPSITTYSDGTYSHTGVTMGGGVDRAFVVSILLPSTYAGGNIRASFGLRTSDAPGSAIIQASTSFTGSGEAMNAYTWNTAVAEVGFASSAVTDWLSGMATLDKTGAAAGKRMLVRVKVPSTVARSVELFDMSLEVDRF